MNLNNETQLISTLRLLVNILNNNQIQYRLLGSVVTCALRNEVYRKINDIDLLVDINKQKVLEDELIKQGFTKTVKNHLRLSEQLNLCIFQHPIFLEISFYGINFIEDGSALLTTPNVRVTIEREAIIPTMYTLQGIDFVGIPAEVVLKTILYSKSNPKREKEFEIMKRLGVKPYQGNIYNVNLLGINVSWFPRFVNYILEIIGLYRIRCGKSYDIWK